MDDSEIVPYVLEKQSEVNTAIQFAKIPDYRKDAIRISDDKLMDYVLSKLDYQKVKLVMAPSPFYETPRNVTQLHNALSYHESNDITYESWNLDQINDKNEKSK